MKNNKIQFITIEGTEGSGKSTVCENIRLFMEEKNIPVKKTREPGGSPTGEEFRNIILNFELDPISEALAFAAGRREHLKSVIIPYLEKGYVVICDRYIDSSIAYQGHARGLGVEKILQINSFAIEDYMPDLTIILSLKPEDGIKRIMIEKSRELNRLDEESIEFHRKCKEGFEMLPRLFPKRKIEYVDASKSIEEVKDEVLEIIRKHSELW